MTDPIRHGIRATYIHHHCRCQACTKAHADYQAKYRNGSTALNNPSRIRTPIAHNTEWMAHAECHGATHLMFPIDDRSVQQNSNRNRLDPGAYDTARAICHGCPVVEPCLEYAIATCQQHGMWGGKTPRERNNIRAQRNKASGAV